MSPPKAKIVSFIRIKLCCNLQREYVKGNKVEIGLLLRGLDSSERKESVKLMISSGCMDWTGFAASECPPARRIALLFRNSQPEAILGLLMAPSSLTRRLVVLMCKIVSRTVVFFLSVSAPPNM